MKTTIKQMFTIEELKSVGFTFLAIFVPILILELQNPYNLWTAGNLEVGLAAAVGAALFRSIIKTVWNLLGVLALKLQSKKGPLPTPPENTNS